MTAKNRSTLAALFENGDVPQGTDYADVFDSFVSISETSAQTIASKLVASGGIETPLVSATNIACPTVSADVIKTASVVTNALRVPGAVSANSVVTDALRSATVSATDAVCDNLRITTSAYNAGTTRLTRVGIGTAAPAEGLQISVSGDNNLKLDIATTVVASAGVSGPATPASVAGFVPVVINGVKRLIAFYNVA